MVGVYREQSVQDASTQTDPATLAALELPQITNLNHFEQAVEKANSDCIEFRMEMEDSNPVRLTGTRVIDGMNNLSLSIELTCQQLEANEYFALNHFRNVHMALRTMTKFQPYYLDPEEQRKTEYLCDLVNRNFYWGLTTELKCREVLQKAAVFKIHNSNRILTRRNYEEYLSHLLALREKTNDCVNDVAAMTAFMLNERRAAVRMLLACRKYMALQRKRPYYPRLCRCRGHDWGQANWERLGLPVISVSPSGNAKGFIPV
ncbi:hypothetical protein AOL_s00078g393 [Orbilia oligospora ATCC 24927]|uniref:Uncharacterized protein n=1 Tax=Arthrobotrys oligospora (strain ATCC 24927 / CBS 115.81 / DSM 1491) TaxID=756982 RepID=G1XBU6_ARTOA|nr:hypothetical protein AOL_s00078g393 [Orbilia oligospora ATCC 24927]EGX49360.1 hypothetical protein AOL_s00078g393 [Orbilia oligospora ATCC 24927]